MEKKNKAEKQSERFEVARGGRLGEPGGGY